MKNQLVIPRFLHQLHGESSNWFDVIVTHLSALTAILAVLTLSNGSSTGWQRWTLIALTYDLAGGVVANFSYGTSSYYARSDRRKLGFIGLHFIHPLFLSILFPDSRLIVIIVFAYAILASFAVVGIKSTLSKATLGALMAVGGIVAFQALFPETDLILKLLLTLSLLKFPLAFAMVWYHPTTRKVTKPQID